ncbi:MAG TPA: hypothetical protein VNY05_24480 [Candidatus Acidoferrales bacterium]|jgi:hypothetical protein|nr:hypothetical protein [Candidatus Acidoferrales bacterium]
MKVTAMRLAAAFCILTLAAAVLPAQQYFPPGVPESKANWYSRHLKALHEPSLWELSLHDPKAEVYRFVWLRAFHHPIAVRLVVRTSRSGWLNSRMTTGEGGHEPGRINR